MLSINGECTISLREFLDIMDWKYIVGKRDWQDTYNLWHLAECTGDNVAVQGVVGIEYVSGDWYSGSET